MKFENLYNTNSKFDLIIVYFFIFTIFLVRFFTETIIILPRILQFSDLGLALVIFVIILFRLLIRDKTRLTGVSGTILTIYFSLLMFSSLINLDRIDGRVIAVYALLQLSPIIFFIYFINIKITEKQIIYLIKVIACLGVLQVVVSIFEIPKALSVSADYLNGTFGWNSTQMLSFLTIIVIISINYFIVNKKWKTRLIVSIFVFIAIGIFYLASWRALWLSFPATILITFLLSNYGIKSKRLIFIFAVIFLLSVNIMYSFSTISGNTYREEDKEFFRIFNIDYDLKDIGKVQALISVFDMYNDHSYMFLFGSGPGTFGSRAYNSFSFSYGDQTDVAYGYINQNYYTDVARKYLYHNSEKYNPIHPSATLNGWQSSYISMLGETGFIGFLLIMLIYYSLIRKMYLLHKKAFDNISYVISIGAVGGIIFLLQTCFFDDYMAVFRSTFPVWFLIALSIRYYEVKNKTLILDTKNI